MEALVRTLSPILQYAGCGIVIVGFIYFGMHFVDLTKGGAGEIPKAVAIMIAGAVVIAFAMSYS